MCAAKKCSRIDCGTGTIGGHVARRTPYSKVLKREQERPAHVQGQGDAVFKVLQCLAASCQAWIVVRRSEAGPGFRIQCEACEHELRDGEATRFFDYDLLVDKKVLESGNFVVDHAEYVRGSPDYKHCLLCYTLKPLDAFGKHAARPESGRQGECRSCKTAYNEIKNKTRIAAQHREASQRRRLLGLLSGETTRINLDEIRERFNYKCFACGTAIDERNEAIDHTLPVRLLWPLTTETATLLCKTCNGQKGVSWPSEFYEDPALRSLAVLTGIPYDRLAGGRVVNEDALAMVQGDPDSFLVEWIHRPDELKALRRLVKDIAGVDILEGAKNVPPYLD